MLIYQLLFHPSHLLSPGGAQIFFDESLYACHNVLWEEKWLDVTAPYSLQWFLLGKCRCLKSSFFLTVISQLWTFFKGPIWESKKLMVLEERHIPNCFSAKQADFCVHQNRDAKSLGPVPCKQTGWCSCAFLMHRKLQACSCHWTFCLIFLLSIDFEPIAFS